MDKETFKDIPGWEGRYQASNLGNIRKVKFGKTGKERVLKPTTWKRYKKVAFTKDGQRKYYWVQRLVWEAFNGPIPEGMVINHIDENPSNNNLTNLMVCTQKENANWGTAIERRKETMRRNYIPPTPEMLAERAERARVRRKELYRSKKIAKFEQMLLDLNVTEEEYKRKKEEDRKERYRLTRKKYYENNKEKFKEASKKWKDAHLEEVRAYHKDYWEKNKHKYRVEKHTYSAQNTKI